MSVEKFLSIILYVRHRNKAKKKQGKKNVSGIRGILLGQLAIMITRIIKLLGSSIVTLALSISGARVARG